MKKEKVYYEVTECLDNGETSILLSNPKAQEEGLRWSRFKDLESAKRRLEKDIQDRKRQYIYYRDDKGKGKIVDKISYYELHRIKHTIYKVVETEEIVYETNNDDVELKRAKEGLQEEISL